MMIKTPIKKAKCHCGKRDRLIVYCGYYICVWCRTGLDRVPRYMQIPKARIRKAS